MKLSLLLLGLFVVVVASTNFGGELRSFPDVVGKTVEQAREYFRLHHPQYDVIFLPEGSPVTLDLRYNRVRVFYNPHTNLVNHTPYAG
uniref:Eglin C n=1 Tax=Hirudinaria manillensis TaxID=1348078 RepID=A0A291RBX5_HIRMN|nr:eglin C [Hirudinaria manillensis]